MVGLAGPSSQHSDPPVLLKLSVPRLTRSGLLDPNQTCSARVLKESAKGCHIDHLGARKRANIGRREGDIPATIKLGDTGDGVKRLQRVFVRTKVLGPDNLDGVFGPQTEKVVKDFQQSNGLVVDGVVGPITWSHLHPYREASPTLQAGSLGPVVAMLQNVLKTGFGYSGAIDDIFGPVTEAVVRQYQTNSSLPVTGVMDERTWIAPAGAAGATLESLSGLKL
jgi:peptidoglycan hydrolase-like protein with peptidoglycan-binding domain